MTTQKEEVNIKSLLDAGAHFGHQQHRWNPKMKPYVFEKRNKLYIIDLAKTMQQIRNAIAFTKSIIEKAGSVLFVGTKKQAKDVIREFAESCEEYYVCERWLGGTLTNLSTIRRSVKTLEKIEKKIETEQDTLIKKELSLLSKQQTKLNKNLCGIRKMRKVPDLMIVVDPNHEHIAVAEAKKLGIPIIALVDTNCNPDPIDFVIACNDDALKSIKLIIQALAQSIRENKKQTIKKIVREEKSSVIKEKKPTLTKEAPKKTVSETKEKVAKKPTTTKKEEKEPKTEKKVKKATKATTTKTKKTSATKGGGEKK